MNSWDYLCQDSIYYAISNYSCLNHSLAMNYFISAPLNKYVPVYWVYTLTF